MLNRAIILILIFPEILQGEIPIIAIRHLNPIVSSRDQQTLPNSIGYTPGDHLTVLTAYCRDLCRSGGGGGGGRKGREAGRTRNSGQTTILGPGEYRRTQPPRRTANSLDG